MQKVLRRTALAKSQAERKARILAEKRYAIEKRNENLRRRDMESERLLALRQSRTMRRDDWEMGPLAPWRDYWSVGSAIHGTWSQTMIEQPKVPVKKRATECFFKVGDRVCVVKGSEHVKGKIGKIIELQRNKESVEIEGVNLFDVRIPAAMQQENSPEIRTETAALPISSIKLVYPLPDPSTGIPRDCILDNLVRRNSRFDVYANEPVFDRVLMPQNIQIPWPEPKDPRHGDEKCDTLRVEVEQKTFLPTLLRPPMPSSVLDECRNKYSKYRDRHDPEWVAAKKAEDAEVVRVKALGEGLRPRGARNVARGSALGSAGGKFMESRRMHPDAESKNLEAVGEWMAAKGLGEGKGKGVPLVVRELPHGLVSEHGQAESSTAP